MPATAHSHDLLVVDFVVPSLVGTACYFLLGVAVLIFSPSFKWLVKLWRVRGISTFNPALLIEEITFQGGWVLFSEQRIEDCTKREKMLIPRKEAKLTRKETKVRNRRVPLLVP